MQSFVSVEDVKQASTRSFGCTNPTVQSDQWWGNVTHRCVQEPSIHQVGVRPHPVSTHPEFESLYRIKDMVLPKDAKVLMEYIDSNWVEYLKNSSTLVLTSLRKKGKGLADHFKAHFGYKPAQTGVQEAEGQESISPLTKFMSSS